MAFDLKAAAAAHFGKPYKVDHASLEAEHRNFDKTVGRLQKQINFALKKKAERLALQETFKEFSAMPIIVDTQLRDHCERQWEMSEALDSLPVRKFVKSPGLNDFDTDKYQEAVKSFMSLIRSKRSEWKTFRKKHRELRLLRELDTGIKSNPIVWRR